MVTKVYGTVNSADIIFSHIEGDLWQTEVPFSSDGVWVCALYAENDIGKKAFICKLLFAITGHQLKIFVIDGGYNMDVKNCQYEGKFEDNGYSGDPDLDKFASHFVESLYKTGVAEKLEFKSHIVERGYKGGYILCDRNRS